MIHKPSFFDGSKFKIGRLKLKLILWSVNFDWYLIWNGTEKIIFFNFNWHVSSMKLNGCHFITFLNFEILKLFS